MAWSDDDEHGPSKLARFGTLFEPKEAVQPILARPVREALIAWLTEIWAATELEAVGLTPRRRAVFDGPPGVGKTTLAHHLAARLGLPMLAVHPERLVDKWLGSTARNIGALFDAARGNKDAPPTLLFFDEFDAVAVSRKRPDTGADEERNAWVDTLLQRFDRHDGFIIAATNHGKNIDPAIWRRFDMHINLALPGQEERERIIARYLAPYGLPRDSLRALAEALETASPALMRQFVEGLKRNIIVGPKVGWDMRRDAVIDRLVAAVLPHPDLGKPRLWSRGAKDVAVQVMPWPLPMAGEITEAPAPTSTDNVIPMGRA